MSRTSRTNLPAGGRRRPDPAASRPPPSPNASSEADPRPAEAPRSCLLVTCTIDGLDHLVLDNPETCAVATSHGTRLVALCGHRVIPERDPARHRGIACEGCAAEAKKHHPALIARGKPPARPRPGIYVLRGCLLDRRAHLVPERARYADGDFVTELAVGGHEIHPDNGLLVCAELCGDCVAALPPGSAIRPSPTGPLLHFRGTP